MSFGDLQYAEFTVIYPANTRRSPNVGLMLGHRLRRWSNITPTLGERLVFAGIWHVVLLDVCDQYLRSHCLRKSKEVFILFKVL